MTFHFKPLQESDLELLCEWLDKPHVLEWWNDNLTHEEIKTKYRGRINDATVVPFIVYINDVPIGFIQYYHANKVSNGWWPEEVDGTLGIDQFIGEEEYLNQGYGTEMVRAFCQKLFANLDIHKIITDVDPKNHRAIRCYEKSGFTHVKEVITPDGLAILMQRAR